MEIERLDHLVLTVREIGETVEFYEQVLGFRAETVEGRTALHFGRQKINLHQLGHEVEPKAERPTTGSGDLCFVTTTPLREVLGHLERVGVPVLEGPVPRAGAVGEMESVYFRDLDGNLIEVSVYL